LDDSQDEQGSTLQTSALQLLISLQFDLLKTLTQNAENETLCERAFQSLSYMSCVIYRSAIDWFKRKSIDSLASSLQLQVIFIYFF